MCVRGVKCVFVCVCVCVCECVCACMYVPTYRIGLLPNAAGSSCQNIRRMKVAIHGGGLAGLDDEEQFMVSAGTAE